MKRKKKKKNFDVSVEGVRHEKFLVFTIEWEIPLTATTEMESGLDRLNEIGEATVTDVKIKEVE